MRQYHQQAGQETVHGAHGEAPFSPGRGVRGPGFSVRQMCYPPGYRQAPHAHDSTGITLVVDGSFCETAQGREEVASALSVVVKPAGTVHSDVVGPRGARTVRVEIDDQARLLSQVGDLGRWRWLHAGPGVQPLLGLLRAQLDPAGEADAEEMVLELLGEVANVPGPPLGNVPAWVRCAREAVDDLAPEGIRVVELARQVGVHPVSLTRAFRRAYGVPVTTYRRRARLRWAASQVVAGKRSLCAIAHASGYADQPHMCREVRAITGLTPSLLREMARS